MLKINLSLIILLSTLSGSDLFYYQSGKKVSLTPFDARHETSRSLSNSQSIHYFKTDSNITLGVNNEIIIKTKHIDIILKKYNLKLKKRLFLDVYLVALKENNATLDIANMLYKNKDVLYAHPNFIREIQKR